MIERITKHDEVYNELHRWDNKISRHFDWENNLMQKSTSGVIRKNQDVGEFVRGLNPIMSLLVDYPVYVRNWKNWRVDKYYNDHPM